MWTSSGKLSFDQFMISVPKPVIGMVMLALTIVFSPLIVGHIVFSALWRDFKGSPGSEHPGPGKEKPGTVKRHDTRVPPSLAGGSLKYAE